jgi:hypothetical protein
MPPPFQALLPIDAMKVRGLNKFFFLIKFKITGTTFIYRCQQLLLKTRTVAQIFFYFYYKGLYHIEIIFCCALDWMHASGERIIRLTILLTNPFI